MGKIIQFAPRLARSRLVRERQLAYARWRAEYQPRFEAYSEKCRRKKALQNVKDRIERSATPPPTHCLRSSNKFAARLTGDPKDQCY